MWQKHKKYVTCKAALHPQTLWHPFVLPAPLLQLQHLSRLPPGLYVLCRPPCKPTPTAFRTPSCASLWRTTCSPWPLRTSSKSKPGPACVLHYMLCMASLMVLFVLPGLCATVCAAWLESLFCIVGILSLLGKLTFSSCCWPLLLLSDLN